MFREGIELRDSVSCRGLNRGRIILVGIVILLLVLFGVVFRLGQMFFGSVTTGESVESPNGKYEADAIESFGETFWGKKRHWFEFELRSKEGETLRYLRTNPIEGPYFGSRSSHRVVFWQDDSSEVVFRFPDVEIRFKTRQ